MDYNKDDLIDAGAALAVVRAYGNERPTAAAYYRAIAAEFAISTAHNPRISS